jgi:hypothetical protein
VEKWNSVASGGGREPPVFFICKSACYAPALLSSMILQNILVLISDAYKAKWRPQGEATLSPSFVWPRKQS